MTGKFSKQLRLILGELPIYKEYFGERFKNNPLAFPQIVPTCRGNPENDSLSPELVRIGS